MKPQFRTQDGAIGVELFVRIPKIDGYPRTTITDEVASGAASAAIFDGRFLSTGKYAILGDAGRNEAEIIKTDTISSNKKTLSIDGTTVFSHSAGDEVRFIPFNRVQIAKSTDSGVTFGSPTTVSLDISNPEHYYQDSAASASDVFRVRFENETTGSVSEWSDSLAGTGYADNTVFSIKKRALESTGMSIEETYRPGVVVTDQYLNEQLYEARRIAHHFKERWSFRRKDNEDIGRLTAGKNWIALPIDLDDQESSKNVFSVRIGTGKRLGWMNKREWDAQQAGRAHTTLNGAVATTDTEIDLTDSGDLEDSGSISVITDGTLDTIEYAVNDKGTNQLSEVTDIDAAHADGTDVWQNPSFGLPERYTIFDNRIYFNCPVAEAYHNINVYSDYYEGVTTVNSDADTLEEYDYDMYVPYLRAAIRMARNQGQSQIDENDPDMRKFNKRLENAAEKDKQETPLRLIPMGR